MRKMLGFTLIELLIVIAVIAILVGITVPRFLGMRDEANTAKAAGECSALKAAVEAYRIHKDDFPPDTAPNNWQAPLTAMRPQLIESALNDPFTSPSTQYTYDVSANGKYYLIWSIGPDGQADIAGISDTGAITLAGACTEPPTAPCDKKEDIYATNGTP
jgi:type II secretion system protein G